jgi:hypothetical protein
MNINAAQQQFAVTEHRINHQGRLEQRSQAIPASVPAAEQIESTPSATQKEEQSDDALKPFNALLSIGAVKKILEQLSTGNLLHWMDNPLDDKPFAPSEDAIAEQQSSAAEGPTTITEWSYQFQQVSASFSGSAELDNGQRLEWSFDFMMQSERFSYNVRQQAALEDPLVLSLNQSPVSLSNTGASLDFYGNGSRQQLPDLAQGQYYLMQDHNGDQQLNSGLELFGPKTGQGYAELAELDQDQNGFIDQGDASWQQLGLWRADTGFRSLADYQIGALSTMSVATPFDLYRGDQLTGRIARSGVYLTENGRAGLMQQIDVNI